MEVQRQVPCSHVAAWPAHLPSGLLALLWSHIFHCKNSPSNLAGCWSNSGGKQINKSDSRKWLSFGILLSDFLSLQAKVLDGWQRHRARMSALFWVLGLTDDEGLEKWLYMVRKHSSCQGWLHQSSINFSLLARGLDLNTCAQSAHLGLQVGWKTYIRPWYCDGSAFQSQRFASRSSLTLRTLTGLKVKGQIPSRCILHVPNLSSYHAILKKSITTML